MYLFREYCIVFGLNTLKMHTIAYVFNPVCYYGIFLKLRRQVRIFLNGLQIIGVLIVAMKLCTLHTP